jgi:hypothetical protein
LNTPHPKAPKDPPPCIMSIFSIYRLEGFELGRLASISFGSIFTSFISSHHGLDSAKSLNIHSLINRIIDYEPIIA